MTPSDNIFEEFQTITGYDLQSYFQNALQFFNTDYVTIVNFYSGYTSSISSQPFQNLQNLQQQNDQVFAIWKDCSSQFNNLKWFLLLEQIEEIDSRLATTENINKWARSSLSNVSYDPSFTLDYILAQNQTIENVAQTVTGSDTPEDDWMQIALDNVLTEESYTNSGGNDLKISFQKSNRNFQISSVVDVIKGKSIYGQRLV